MQTGSFRMVSEEEQAMRSKLEHLTVKDHGPVFGPCHKLPGHTVQKVKNNNSGWLCTHCLRPCRHQHWPCSSNAILEKNVLFVFFFTLQAKDELNETDERRASSLKDLRAMMKERAAEGDDLAKLVLERFGDKPDSLLLRFLRARKFDVVRAHELMKGEY